MGLWSIRTLCTFCTNSKTRNKESSSKDLHLELVSLAMKCRNVLKQSGCVSLFEGPLLLGGFESLTHFWLIQRATERTLPIQFFKGYVTSPRLIGRNFAIVQDLRNTFQGNPQLLGHAKHFCAPSFLEGLLIRHTLRHTQLAAAWCSPSCRAPRRPPSCSRS